jgi:hypothetical protein
LWTADEELVSGVLVFVACGRNCKYITQLTLHLLYVESNVTSYILVQKNQEEEFF